MFKMSKFGLLTTTTLMSLVLLTSCSSDDTSSDVTVTPGTAPQIETTVPTTPDNDDNDDNVVGDMSMENLDEEAGEHLGEAIPDSKEETETPEEETEEEADTTTDSTEAVTPASLNSKSVTLESVGATYTFSISGGKDVKDVSYTVDNEAVAMISNTGMVTALSNGTANVTVSYTSDGNSETLKATVTVNVPEPEPEPEPAPEPEPTPEPEVAPESSSASVTGFYQSVTSQNEFGMLQEVTGEFLANFFPGMSGVSTNQQQIYMAAMTATPVEFAIVEVASGSDVDTVKSIFNTRIQTQIDGGAFYPDTIEGWKNNSRVVSKGNFVMMIVHENCDAIVSLFNGTF